MGFYNGVLLIRTLYLVPFARYSASKISVSDLVLSGSPKVKYLPFWMRLYNGILLIETLYLVPLARYSASKNSVSDLDLSGLPKVKYFTFFEKPIWHFILTFCWYELSISNRWRDIPHLRFRLATLTSQGQRKSNISPFWEADMRLCNDLLLIGTLYLVPFARYSPSKISINDLDLSGSPKVKYFTFFGKPIWHFIMAFCWYELSISYRLRDIPHLRFPLMTSTFQGHRRSNILPFLGSWYATL